MKKEIIKKIFEKLKKIEDEISKEKGDFSLFGLVLRDSKDKYELAVSAPWLEDDKRKGLEFLAGKVISKLDRDELLLISRIVILEKGSPTLAAVFKAVTVKRGDAHIKNTYLSNLLVDEAFISTSSPVNIKKIF